MQRIPTTSLSSTSDDSTEKSKLNSRYEGSIREDSVYDDEIDLLALLKALLATWKHWFLSIILVSVVFGAVLLPSYFYASKQALYTKNISFSFKGADSAEYPSGATFRLNDIVAPAIVQSVYSKLGEELTSQFSVSELNNAVNIQPYTPFYDEIDKKYSLLLASNNLDYATVQAIQDRKSNELNQMMNNSAVLSFDPKKLDIPSTQVDLILTDIVKEWARQSINDKGVLKADIELNSSLTLDSDLFKNVDYVVLSDLFSDKTEALNENIEKVKKLEGSATVRDPDTGWSLSDLKNNLSDLEKYTIDELMSPIRSLGLSRNPKLAIFYYQEKKAILQDQAARLKEEADLIKSAFSAYSDDNSSVVQNSVPTGSPGFGTYVPQLSGDLIDKLLQADGEDSAERYKQQLNDQWLETNLALAETNAEIRSVERLIAAVEGNGDNNLAVELRDEYLKRAENTVPMILAKLKDYYEINSRIYEQLSRERIGGIGYLYRENHNGLLRGDSGFSLKRFILLYVATMFLVSIIVIPAVMIKNALRQRKLAEQVEYS